MKKASTPPKRKLLSSYHRPAVLLLSHPSLLKEKTPEQQNQLEQQTQMYEKRKKYFHELPSWNLGNHISSLPDIPFFHAFTPFTHIILKESYTSPLCVGETIAQCVASMSAMGNYNVMQAYATIHTIDNVKLQIQLYRTKDHKNIIVEIVRIKGDVIRYHKVTKILFGTITKQEPRTQEANENDNTAEKKTKCLNEESSTTSSLSRPQMSMQRNSPNRLLQLIQPKSYSRDIRATEEIYQRTMENIRTLLQKDRWDAVISGMESLLLLTDDSSYYNANHSRDHKHYIMTEAAKAVLQDGIWQDVKECIFSLVFSQDNNEDNDNEIAKIKNLALQILANCLSVTVNNSGSQFVLIHSENRDEWRGILLTLTGLMKNEMTQDNNPQDIYQAARCIKHLLQLSEEMKIFAAHLEVTKNVTKYHNSYNERYQCKHVLLHDVSGDIIGLLGESM